MNTIFSKKLGAFRITIEKTVVRKQATLKKKFAFWPVVAEDGTRIFWDSYLEVTIDGHPRKYIHFPYDTEVNELIETPMIVTSCPEKYSGRYHILPASERFPDYPRARIDGARVGECYAKSSPTDQPRGIK